MLGFGPIGSYPIGGGPMMQVLKDAAPTASVTISSLVVPDRGLLIAERKVAEGILIRSTTAIWDAIAQRLGKDWSQAMRLSSTQWEEMIAGAFKKAQYDEVVLTPRSADGGRDVIAIKHGVGCIKLIGSVKAYKPGHLVTHDDVRALLGVLSAEQDASKGIVATTSAFAPKIEDSPQFKPFLPTRLELIDGPRLQDWLIKLSTQ